MKLLLTIGIVALSVLGIQRAEAKHYYHRHHVTSHKFSRHLTHRYFHRRKHYAFARTSGSLPGPCRVAASMGGPCGCWAGHILLGTTQHVWKGINLWLANDWLRFPHVSPSPGTAAVWPHRHVAPVLEASGNRVKVHDSWAIHWVSRSGLVFVQPPTKKPKLLHVAYSRTLDGL